jgi:hypothetical protein
MAIQSYKILKFQNFKSDYYFHIALYNYFFLRKKLINLNGITCN